MSKKYWDNKRVLITGGGGFLGGELVRQLKKLNPVSIRITDRKKYDLRKYQDCLKASKNIDVVIHLAANVGGIGYNRQFPADLFDDNILMGVQMMRAAKVNRVKKYVAIGTVCAYPKFTPVPFKEMDLWNGYPEETNAPYGMAKKMQLVQAQAYRQQFGFNAIFLLPVNLYGPGDNFDLNSSHVLPALIRKFVEAKKSGAKAVEVWGTGMASREFLYIEDAARGIIKAAEIYNKPDPINLGAGFEVKIKDLVERIKNIVGFDGRVVWDKSKPDGQPRRMLDVSAAAREFGFKAATDFNEGLRTTIKWYESRFK